MMQELVFFFRCEWDKDTILKFSIGLSGKFCLWITESISTLLNSTGISWIIKRGLLLILSLTSSPTSRNDWQSVRMAKLHESPAITMDLLAANKIRLMRSPSSTGLTRSRNFFFVASENTKVTEVGSDSPIMTCESDRIGMVLRLSRITFYCVVALSRGIELLDTLAYVLSWNEATLVMQEEMLSRDIREAFTLSIMLERSFWRRLAVFSDETRRV